VTLVRVLQKLLMSVVVFASTLALVGVGLMAATAWANRRYDVIDRLESPRNTAGWTSAGLTLDDASLLRLPGVAALPEVSELLAAMVERGVELDPRDGRVYGLLPIWHWCGDDPVRRHVARVDLARVLEFSRESENAAGRAAWDCTSVSEFGWNVSCYRGYERWLADCNMSEE
jgi:hypothetical protein